MPPRSVLMANRGTERSETYRRGRLADWAGRGAAAAMFDKPATAARLHASGVPVPNWLEQPREAFAAVADSEDGRGWPTAYLKLNTGSSATGIIVVHLREGRFHGTTTLAEI